MMKVIQRAVIPILFVLSSIVSYGQHGTVSVEVTNIKSNEGNILIGLFDSKKSFLKRPLKGKKLKAQKGTVKAVFEKLHVGTYTVSVIHDENANNNLDTNFIGIPNEPYGISMEGKSMFGPPSYDKAKFEVSNQHLDLTISL